MLRAHRVPPQDPDGFAEAMLKEAAQGRVSSAALRTALAHGGEGKQQFLAAMKAGGVQTLVLDLPAAGTEDDVAAVLDVLDPHILQELTMCGSSAIRTLPDAICSFISLHTLKLTRLGLTSLPLEFGRLSLAGDL